MPTRRHDGWWSVRCTILAVRSRRCRSSSGPGPPHDPVAPLRGQGWGRVKSVSFRRACFREKVETAFVSQACCRAAYVAYIRCAGTTMGRSGKHRGGTGVPHLVMGETPTPNVVRSRCADDTPRTCRRSPHGHLEGGRLVVNPRVDGWSCIASCTKRPPLSTTGGFRRLCSIEGGSQRWCMT